MADTKTTLIDGRTCTIEVDYYVDGRCHIHTPLEASTLRVVPTPTDGEDAEWTKQLTIFNGRWTGSGSNTTWGSTVCVTASIL